MFCPKCGCEYREKFYKCTDCNVTLVKELPKKSGHEKLVTLFKTGNQTIIDNAKSILQDAGVEYFIKQISIHDNAGLRGIGGDTISNLFKVVEIQVDQNNLEKAQNLLNQLDKKKFDDNQVCSKCGEKIEGNFNECWKCSGLKLSSEDKELLGQTVSTEGKRPLQKKKKVCPVCNKEISYKVKKCPNCKKQIEILCWEVEKTSGEKSLFSDPDAEKAIQEQLLSGKIKLSNRCRQFVKVLKEVKEGSEYYELTKDKGWKTLRDYADKVFSLQILYNPREAYGKKYTYITGALVGIIISVFWITDGLLAAGASTIMAIIWSISLLLSFPTLIGFAIVMNVIAGIYNLPLLAITFRSFFAISIGILLGGGIGKTLGYFIGYHIGATKRENDRIISKYIIKLAGKYLEWSECRKAPNSFGMNLEDFRIYYYKQYGERSMREFEAQIKYIEKNGTNSANGKTIDEIIDGNKAGDNEEELTKEEIIEKYINSAPVNG